MDELRPIVTNLKQEGHFVRACISTAFYCPYEGKMESEDTLALCKEFVSWGVMNLVSQIQLEWPIHKKAMNYLHALKKNSTAYVNYCTFSRYT